MITALMLLTAFLSGAALMAIEMTAARLIAPWFGATFLVWTAVLALVLLAVVGGGVAGGARAERSPSPYSLYPLCLAAASWLALVPFAAAPLCHLLVMKVGLTGPFGAGLALAFLVGPPVLLLAMIPPAAVRSLAEQPEQAGGAAGRVSAVSTLGSVIGTCLPGLVLLPAFGTRMTLCGLAAGLALLALVGHGVLALIKPPVAPQSA